MAEFRVTRARNGTRATFRSEAILGFVSVLPDSARALGYGRAGTVLVYSTRAGAREFAIQERFEYVAAVVGRARGHDLRRPASGRELVWLWFRIRAVLSALRRLRR